MAGPMGHTGLRRPPPSRERSPGALARAGRAFRGFVARKVFLPSTEVQSPAPRPQPLSHWMPNAARRVLPQSPTVRAMPFAVRTSLTRRAPMTRRPGPRVMRGALRHIAVATELRQSASLGLMAQRLAGMIDPGSCHRTERIRKGFRTGDRRWVSRDRQFKKGNSSMGVRGAPHRASARSKDREDRPIAVGGGCRHSERQGLSVLCRRRGALWPEQ